MRHKLGTIILKVEAPQPLFGHKFVNIVDFWGKFGGVFLIFRRALADPHVNKSQIVRAYAGIIAASLRHLVSAILSPGYLAVEKAVGRISRGHSL